jgi:hypothetical protein
VTPRAPPTSSSPFIFHSTLLSHAAAVHHTPPSRHGRWPPSTRARSGTTPRPSHSRPTRMYLVDKNKSLAAIPTARCCHIHLSEPPPSPWAPAAVGDPTTDCPSVHCIALHHHHQGPTPSVNSTPANPTPSPPFLSPHRQPCLAVVPLFPSFSH